MINNTFTRFRETGLQAGFASTGKPKWRKGLPKSV